MSTAFVLIMFWTVHGYREQSVAIVQQEFSSYESCEAVRQSLAKLHSTSSHGVRLKSQGCYKK